MTLTINPDAPTDAFRNRVLVGDAATRLREIPDDSIDTIITSPPYFLTRRYASGPDEIGTEDHVDTYVNRLVEVMAELDRVLKPTGSLWLNLGDSYSRGDRFGAPAKSLLLAPERLLVQLTQRGWICRNKVVWTKTNPMPQSVRDRLTCTWEPFFHLVRERSYFYDLDAARIPATSTRRAAKHTKLGKYEGRSPWAGPLAGSNDGLTRAREEGRAAHPLGKNPGDSWRLATAGFRGEHPAVFPEKLLEIPISVSCPERTCRSCGTPWRREARRDRLGDLHPTCEHRAGWVPGVVLDPFLGSGTTAVVARRLDRDWVGIEANPRFVAITDQRLNPSPGSTG